MDVTVRQKSEERREQEKGKEERELSKQTEKADEYMGRWIGAKKMYKTKKQTNMSGWKSTAAHGEDTEDVTRDFGDKGRHRCGSGSLVFSAIIIHFFIHTLAVCCLQDGSLFHESSKKCVQAVDKTDNGKPAPSLQPCSGSPHQQWFFQERM